MTTGIWVLGDQLWTGQAALSSCEAEKSQTFFNNLTKPACSK